NVVRITDGTPLRSPAGVGDLVQRPDRPVGVLEGEGLEVLRAQGVRIDHDHLAGDRLEGRPEVVHRLHRHRGLARRIDAQRRVLPEVQGLAVVGDEDDVDAADPEDHAEAVLAPHAAAHRAIGPDLAVIDDADLAGQRQRPAALGRVPLAADRDGGGVADAGLD
ncbi:Uncharacterized protein APZ42_003139, partial [Daphnia magna]